MQSLSNQRQSIPKVCKKCGNSFIAHAKTQLYCQECKTKKPKINYCGVCGRHLSNYTKIELFNGQYRLCEWCRRRKQVSTRKRFIMPKVCPNCKGVLVKSTQFNEVFCENANCSVVFIDSRGSHFASDSQFRTKTG